MSDKSAGVNTFSELLLTDEFRHFLGMSAPSYINFHILITYTSYITYTYDYTACIDYVIIILILQLTPVHVFHFYN